MLFLSGFWMMALLLSGFWVLELLLSGSLSEFTFICRYNLSPRPTFGNSDFRTLYLMLLDTFFNILTPEFSC